MEKFSCVFIAKRNNHLPSWLPHDCAGSHPPLPSADDTLLLKDVQHIISSLIDFLFNSPVDLPSLYIGRRKILCD